MRRMALLIAILLGMGAVSARGDVVHRRGGAPPLYGDIRVSEKGILVRSERGVEHPVSWDRVKEIVPAPADPGYRVWKVRADRLWRARTRVERDDTVLAESGFEELFPVYRGQTHETALVVAEGLLRCRLARGAQAGAIIPALETARLRRAGITTTSYSRLPPVIDKETSLCPFLPPAWEDDRAGERIRAALVRFDGRGDEVMEALARLYRESITPPAERNETWDELPNHPGVKLMRQLVDCGGGGRSERETARNQLLQNLKKRELPPWIEPWIRYAVGRSFLQETGRGRRQRGIVQLLHIPARWGSRRPYLTRLALVHAALGMESMNRSVEAARLRQEAVDLFPTHSFPGEARNHETDGNT